jgi:hypothetical protein
MKNNTLKTILKPATSSVVFFAALLFLLQACKKGDTGDPGTPGRDGAANVIYSAWFKPNVYIKDTVFGIAGFNYNKSAPDITQSMLDSGTIITYGKLQGYTPVIWPTSQVTTLPILLTYNSGGISTDTWSALISVGNLRIRLVNDKNAYGSISNAHEFRYIIIPPGKKATLSVRRSGDGSVPVVSTVSDFSVRKVITDHEHMTYGEVCRLLNIPE